MMLTDPTDLKLIAEAREPGLRDPRRQVHGPREILRDFVQDRAPAGTHVLELGPGHYEFCDLLRAAGGQASAVELDPPIAELGRRHGHTIHVHNLRELVSLEPGVRYDGLFCKGSNNPFWFYGDEAGLDRYTAKLRSLVKDDGWVWVVACPYAATQLAPAEFARWLDVERASYRRHGFVEWPVTNRLVAGYYGISVPCEGLSVFTWGLPPHRWSFASRLQLARRLLTRGPAAVLRRITGRR
jgi:hypothetical protein